MSETSAILIMIHRPRANTSPGPEWLPEQDRLPVVTHSFLIERDRQGTAQIGVRHRDDRSLGPPPFLGCLHQGCAHTPAPVTLRDREEVHHEPRTGQVTLELPVRV